MVHAHRGTHYWLHGFVQTLKTIKYCCGLMHNLRAGGEMKLKIGIMLLGANLDFE